VLQVREHFANGVSHGLRTKWHPNGHKAAEGLIVNGQHDGQFRRWHEDGSLAEEIQMAAGVPDGPARAWYPSGFLKAKTFLTAGKVMAHQNWKDQEVVEESAGGAR
jgi:antitoxin component YwqK of YwqJK toxin-antitoxin module